MVLRTFTSALSIALLTTVAACGSSDSGPSATTDSGKADTGGGETIGPKKCEEAGTVYVKNATGKVTDIAGKSLVGKSISVCGNICYPGTTAADGTFDVAIDECIKVEIFSVSVHGRPDYASLYQRAPALTGTSIVLTDVFKLPLLPTDGPKIPMDDKTGEVATKATIENGGLSLTFDAGTHVGLDIEDIELAALGQKLRVTKVETKDFPPFTKGQNVLALYAANPFDAAFTKKKVGISFAAPAGLAAGAKVEFVALGNTFLSAPFDAGLLVVVGGGSVSSDGKTVSTDAGQGLSALTWVGVRAAK